MLVGERLGALISAALGPLALLESHVCVRVRVLVCVPGGE